MMDKQSFRAYLEEQPVISSHCHHLQAGEHQGMGLAGLLRQSYVNWCGVPVPDGDDPEAVENWLDAVGTRSYFVWLEKALMDIYGISERISAGTWGAYDRAIRQAHQDPDWHMRLLRDKCRYEAVMMDAYWAPGDDHGRPELFKPVYRVNSMFYGYNQSARDHNGHNFQLLEGTSITDIDEYLKQIERVLRDRKQAGCVAFKCALAYDRGLNFGPGNRAQAQNAMGENPQEEDILAFQNLVMDKICQVAEALNIPIQMHTGLGLMQDSRAIMLQPLIARYPEVTFVLMHGSYPWIADIPGLCHVYPNVWADLCWLPLISAAAAARMLDELIDVCNADRIVWGCDAWTGEESYAARLAFLDVLTRVLTGRVQAGLMGEGDAKRFARMLLHDNARMLVNRA